MGSRSYRVSRVIDAPASVVWGLLTDAASYAVFADSLKEAAEARTAPT